MFPIDEFIASFVNNLFRSKELFILLWAMVWYNVDKL